VEDRRGRQTRTPLMRENYSTGLDAIRFRAWQKSQKILKRLQNSARAVIPNLQSTSRRNCDRWNSPARVAAQSR
jgi:hypothetical protein